MKIVTSFEARCSSFSNDTSTLPKAKSKVSRALRWTNSTDRSNVTDRSNDTDEESKEAPLWIGMQIPLCTDIYTTTASEITDKRRVLRYRWHFWVEPFFPRLYTWRDTIVLLLLLLPWNHELRQRYIALFGWFLFWMKGLLIPKSSGFFHYCD